MKSWQKALLYSVCFVVLTLGVAWLHTEVILAGKITPAQDGMISETYGRVIPWGLVAIWFGVFHRKKKDQAIQ